MKPKIRLKERKTPFISSKEFLKIDAQYIDGEKLLKKIIKDRGKIITDLTERIKDLEAQIVALKLKSKYDGDYIKRLRDEKVIIADDVSNHSQDCYRRIKVLEKRCDELTELHECMAQHCLELENILKRNHIDFGYISYLYDKKIMSIIRKYGKIDL